MKFPNLFTADQQQVLTALEHQDRSERQAGSTDPLRLKAISPSVGHYLYLAALRGKARTLAEFGTSAGYSTLYLAATAQHSGGRVHTVDRQAEKTAWARANLTRAGLVDRVDFFTGEGTDFAQKLPDGLDLVLLDFGVPSILPVLETIKTKMAPNALFFVDGWESLERWETEVAWRHLKENLEQDPNFITCMLPLEKGHLIAHKL